MTELDRQPRRWSSAEDQILRAQVETQQAEGGSKDWCRVALALPGRTNKDCRKRWHNSVTEGLRKGQWSRSEDQLLTDGVHRYGSRWTKVATCVGSRSADQCAKRWQQSLDPCLDRSEWREDEDSALLTAVNCLGRHWKDIQKQYLPRRSKNCVKNRYSVLARRYAAQLASYDDSMGSSSSDPDTPLPQEAEMPRGYKSMTATKQNRRVPDVPSAMTGTSSKELLWAWSGLSNPNVLMTASPHATVGMDAWPMQYNGDDSFTHLGSHSDWCHAQTAMPPQYPSNYFSVSYPLSQGYLVSSPQHPHGSPNRFYTSVSTQSTALNVPSSRSPALDANTACPDYQYRDTVPF